MLYAYWQCQYVEYSRQRTKPKNVNYETHQRKAETITKLINASTIQSRIITRNPSVCQKYMVFIQLEMERNCTSDRNGFCCKTVTKSIIRSGRDTHSGHSHDGRGCANHCLLPRYSLSVFITRANCRDGGGEEINDWTGYQTLCISSNLHLALDLTLLFSQAKRLQERTYSFVGAATISFQVSINFQIHRFDLMFQQQS